MCKLVMYSTCMLGVILYVHYSTRHVDNLGLPSVLVIHTVFTHEKQSSVLKYNINPPYNSYRLTERP